LQRYEYPKAAMLPLLWLVPQSQGFFSPGSGGWGGNLVGGSIAPVREGVSFFNMFHTKPPGRHQLRLWPSFPCFFRCAGQLLERVQDELHIGRSETTPGQEVTLTEVECLCACEMAPMAQLDERFVGPLEGEAVQRIIHDALREPGEPESTPEPHPFICSEG